MNNDNDLKSCSDLMIIPSNSGKIDIIGGMTCILNSTAWKYVSEMSDGNKKVYSTNAKLQIIDNNMNSFTTSKDVLLYRQNNGIQQLKINFFDGSNSIEIVL